MIMPNHLHGIIIIEDTETPVSTINSFRKSSSLGSIINQFKGKCTKRIRKAGHPDFAWQPRYFDHIIRNDESLQNIRRYIEENPVKWEMDDYYSKGS